MAAKQQKPSIALLSDYTPHSRFAEAYRTLRTNIQFSLMDKKLKILLVTSAGAGEGKTSTVANLAYTMAQTGKRVLMLDADMRRPTLSKILTNAETTGITGLLANFFGTMPDRGSLEEMGAGDLVKLLALQKKSGRLTLKSESDVLEVFFVNGAMADTYWRTRPESKTLLKILTRENAMSVEQAELAGNRQRDTGQRMEYIIVNMGLANDDALKGALNMHIIEALQVFFRMRAGTFEFHELPAAHLELDLAGLVDLQQLTRQANPGREVLFYLEEKIKAAVIHISDHLFLLPSGPLPPNPSEILGSFRMEFLLHYLRNMFDVIIIDTPPILPASDALLVSPHADGVLLVVKAGMLNRDMVQKAVEQLELGQANVLGVVLNDVDINRAGYANYYHKYYSGYYGEQTSDQETGRK